LDQIQWLERSPQAIDRAKFAKQFLMPPVMSASPPAIVMAVMAVTPAPAPMMAMTANLNETAAVGSTKVVGTRNRHRGGWQDPCDDRTNNNQALSHFYSCSQVADKTRCIQPRRGTLVPGRGTNTQSARCRATDEMEEVAMKRAIILSAAILLAVGASAIAAERPGASSMSPGHEMQNSTSSSTKGDVDSKTTKGASEYSPGDRMHDKSTTGMSKSKSKGASEYTPGDRMNDRK
jgi:hypothetical protein